MLDLLRSQEVVAKPKKAPSISIRDPDDAWVLASAIEGRCDASSLATAIFWTSATQRRYGF